MFGERKRQAKREQEALAREQAKKAEVLALAEAQARAREEHEQRLRAQNQAKMEEKLVPLSGGGHPQAPGFAPRDLTATRDFDGESTRPAPGAPVQKGPDKDAIWDFIGDSDAAEPINPSSAPSGPSSGRIDSFSPEGAAGQADSPPPLPNTPAATGLPEHFIQELILKVFYFDGRQRGVDVAHTIRLNYNATEPALDFLKEQQFVGVVGGGSAFGKQSMEYSITDKGVNKVKEVLVRDNYYGPAPVPITSFVRRVEMQSIERYHISPADVQRAFSRLVLDPKVPELMGPAINSGRSMFLYGPPGNGKTALAECITDSVGGSVYMPYSVFIDRQIIKVFDPLYHEVIPATADEEKRMDQRWLKCKRPIVMVGGELTMETLDLVAHGGATYYEAPFQFKATNGVLFIDDFGRQRAEPGELLNRWIVPLESRFDFLTFASGLKVRVPFDCLLVFSTNLDPKQLVDDAFLRRIRYKINIDNPTEENFRKIWKIFSQMKKVPYQQETLEYLIDTHYKKAGRPFRACHPRDLMEQFIDIQKYTGEEQGELTPEMLDRLCGFYFVEIMDD